MAEQLLSAGDVANLAGWHLVTVYRKARSGEIPGVVRLGYSLRFKESVIDAWLKGGTKFIERRHYANEHNR